MKSITTFLALMLIIALAYGHPAQPNMHKPTDSRSLSPILQVPLQKIQGYFAIPDYLINMSSLNVTLIAEAAALSPQAHIKVIVTDDEIKKIDEYSCETCGQSSSDRMKNRVGLVKPVNTYIDFSTVKPEYLRPQKDGGYSWTGSIEIPKATAVRIHFSEVSLPRNGALYIYNDNEEAFGPYKPESGDFWTNTVTGEIAYIQVRIAGEISKPDLDATRFMISDAVFLGEKFLTAGEQKRSQVPEGRSATLVHCTQNAHCVEDMNCFDTSDWYRIDDVKYGIAHMVFNDGVYVYNCTGGLMNDTVPNNYIPYFLTANHCLDTEAMADTLECFWRFWTASCGSGYYNPNTAASLPRTLGASLLSTSSGHGDYTLLRLDQYPPNGSAMLGWTTEVVANTDNFSLYRISHPKGTPMAYSTHSIDENSWACPSWPKSHWIYSQDVIGATESGSSGSPVCNIHGQAVGQLSGACGTNTGNVCDSGNNRTADGAFAAYFTEIKPWLAPPATLMHVHNITPGDSDYDPSFSIQADVYVRDGNGNPVPNAYVYADFKHTHLTTILPAAGFKVTDANGKAVFHYIIPQFTFPILTPGHYYLCVGNITHSSKYYDASDNVVNCINY